MTAHRKHSNEPATTFARRHISRSSKMRLHVFRSFHRLRAYMVRRVFKKRKIGSSMREAIGSFRSKRYARF